MGILIGILDSIFLVFSYVWWFVLPVFLFYLAWKLYMIFMRARYIKTIEWSMAEIKIPANILKTPKAMEQVFAEMTAMYSFKFKPAAVYLEGKIEDWMSFEMLGHKGGVHFYVYFPSKYRNLLESAIYAQYPEAEIHPADDYTDVLASVLPNEVYDIWGTEIILSRENYYPIRTYPYFEEVEEEKRVDPIAAIAEVMSNLEEEEMIWLQFLISPTGRETGDDWQDQGWQMIGELAGRESPQKKKGLGFDISDFIRNLFWAPAEHPIWPGTEKTEAMQMIRFLHPAEQEVVKAVSNKISKFGFETVIRFVYIDRRDSFTSSNVSAIIGFFQQFRAQNLNSFKPNGKTITLKTGWLPHLSHFYKRMAEFSRKRRLFYRYRTRRFGKYNKTRPEKLSILNTEELATVYHFPAGIVAAPRLRKVEAKKGGPPAELPIES